MTLQNIIEIIRRKDLQDVAGDTPERPIHPQIAKFRARYGFPPYKFQSIQDDPEYVEEEIVK